MKKIEFTFLYESEGYITYSIEVVSNSFSGIGTYCDHRNYLNLWIDQLYNLYNSLNGEVCIQDYDTGDCIYFSAKQYGQIKVSGNISDFVQSLRFEFLIDQTYLPDIINELKSLLEHS